MPVDASTPWEQKSRGLAVFRSTARFPIAGIDTKPGTLVLSPDERLPPVRGTEQRIIVTDGPSPVLLQSKALERLIDTIILPAYRRRIPLYFFTACSTDLLMPVSLPLFDRTNGSAVFQRLRCEQLRILLASMCIVFPTPEASAAASGPLRTPVECYLAAVFDRTDLTYASHVSLGARVVDFLIAGPDGRRLVVEADGRDFHDAAQQARDALLLKRQDIAAVLRFSGSQVLYAGRRCADLVKDRLSSPATMPVRPLPAPGLSPEQARCLSPRAGVILTLAPAGSGKTRVLTRRVVEAVRGGIVPERVLCVVFNKGARDVMVTRVHREASLPDVRICTLHSLGYEICRTAPGSPCTGFSVATTRSQDSGVRHLYREALRRDLDTPRPPLHTPARRIFPEHLVVAYEEAGEHHKKTLTPVGAWPEGETVEDFDTHQATRVNRMVQDELNRRRLLTFDDQIYRAVEILLASPRARRHYQQMFDAVFVDEVQDLTPVQFLLIRLLSLPLNNLFAVGDDDQIINSFAGANPANIRDFTETFIGATIHTLGENHRCAPDIVIRSANVITYNRQRFPKPIRPSARQIESTRDASGVHRPAVRIFHGPSLDAEARAVLKTIRQWITEGMAYRDIAILVRVRPVASLVQFALAEQHMPFHPIEQAAFFSSEPGKLLGAYMRICHHPATAIPEDYSRALSIPSRYLSNEHLRRIADKGWPLVQRSDAFPPYAQSAIRAFNASIHLIHRRYCASAGTSMDFLNAIIEQFHIEAYFTHRERSRRRTYTSTPGDIITMIRALATEHPHIATFVTDYHRRIREEEALPRRAVAHGDGIHLSTIHGSKGDEFRAVVLFHAAEHTLPHRRMVTTGNPADLEEERRVFYVAVTRAIERLFITTDAARPSRFLDELDRPYRAKGVRKPGFVQGIFRRKRVKRLLQWIFFKK